MRHGLISAVAGAAFGELTGCAEAGFAVFLAGTLIDVDHLFDYCTAQGPKMDLGLIRSGEYFRTNGRVYVLLHSYEVVAIASLLAALAGGWILGLAVAFGSLLHLCSDMLYYGFNPLCYSLAYRVHHRFELSAFKRRPMPLRGEGRTT